MQKQKGRAREKSCEIEMQEKAESVDLIAPVHLVSKYIARYLARLQEQ
jgi:hypothetical protein